jgi:ABC-type Fe3+-hydroxamate transport system substrate-binding protein
MRYGLWVQFIRVRDDLGRDVQLPAPARRVVALVPSDTYNVAALGRADVLVGRTDYCELPVETVAGLPSVGGTKSARVDDIVALEPDLVLANQEENTRAVLEALAQRGVRVYVAFPKRVADGLRHLAVLARMLGAERDEGVRDLLLRGYQQLREAETASAERPAVRVFCPIWMDPLMTIHGDTFMSDMLGVCGAENIFADRARRYPLAADLGRAAPLSPEKVGDRDTRYPRVTLDEVVARNPDLVVLPDEPHPFTEQDAAVFRALPRPGPDRVVGVSGKDLCWYGARSVEGVARVQTLIASLSPRLPGAL